MAKCDVGKALRAMFRPVSTACRTTAKPRAKRAKRTNVARELAMIFAPAPARPSRRVEVVMVEPYRRAAMRAAIIPPRALPAGWTTTTRYDATPVPLQLGPGTKPAKRAKAKRPRVDLSGVEFAVEAIEGDPFAVPQPIAPPGYRPPQCATDSPAWGPEYTEALGEASERAAIEAGDDDEAFRKLLRIYFEEHPRFPEWSEIEHECVADFRRRHPRKKRRTVTSSMETAMAIEEASAELGYDVRGSAEHLDRLTLGSQAAYWRRVYKRTHSEDALRRARELEARNRAAKRKGAGIATHRAG